MVEKAGGQKSVGLPKLYQNWPRGELHHLTPLVIALQISATPNTVN
jgi:hypothetical protein